MQRNGGNRYRSSNVDKDSVIYGLRAIIEAIKAGKELDKILIKKGLSGELFGELRAVLKDTNIPVQYVPIEKLNRVTRSNHQGAIAFASAVEYQDIENVLPMVYEEGKTPFFLILDKVSDVRNFGAIVRSAECAGVDAIIFPSRGSAQLNADAVKTSAGALHRVPVCRSHNLKETIDYLKESGIKIVSCTEKTDDFYTDVDYKEPVAIIMGAEDVGISDEYLKRSDHKAKIPMFGEISSLNVSVACGVIMYEVVRQRKI
jgi:23S rRNA (guanosine2251-2'-O)-methyltransferase